MKKRSLLADVTAFTLGLVLAMTVGYVSVFGQAGTSTVRGTVTDPQGNVVAGATVTLTNTGKNTTRTTTTTDEWHPAARIR